MQGRQPAGAQSPAFAECRAVADLDRDVTPIRIQFCPKRIGFVERDRLLAFVMRSEYVHRFTPAKFFAEIELFFNFGFGPIT